MADDFNTQAHQQEEMNRVLVDIEIEKDKNNDDDRNKR
jgi:hypothetical protein